MKQSMTSLFLAQNYENAWADFQHSLHMPGFPCWNYLILTASNEQQAEGLRAQLRQRTLPEHTHVAVISDPGCHAHTRRTSKPCRVEFISSLDVNGLGMPRGDL